MEWRLSDLDQLAGPSRYVPSSERGAGAQIRRRRLERIDDFDPSQVLAVLKILGEQKAAASPLRRGDDQRVPP